MDSIESLLTQARPRRTSLLLKHRTFGPSVAVRLGSLMCSRPAMALAVFTLLAALSIHPDLAVTTGTAKTHQDQASDQLLLSSAIYSTGRHTGFEYEIRRFAAHELTLPPMSPARMQSPVNHTASINLATLEWTNQGLSPSTTRFDFPPQETNFHGFPPATQGGMSNTWQL